MSSTPPSRHAEPASGGGWLVPVLLGLGVVVVAVGVAIGVALLVLPGDDDVDDVEVAASIAEAEDEGADATDTDEGEGDEGGADADVADDGADDVGAGGGATDTGADEGGTDGGAADEGGADEGADVADGGSTDDEAASETDPSVDDDAEAGAGADAADDDAAQDPATLPGTDLVDPADAVRRAVFRGGQVHLEGRVPSQEVADEIAGKAARVVGEENVVVDYVVDEDAPLPSSAPLFVADRVLFDTGSAEVLPAFVPLLELGVDLLERVPGSSLTVIGHTDEVGPADANLVLSQQRVDAVVAYLTDAGIDPARINGVARGETDPIPGAGLEANRRTEFVVNDLLDG